MWFRFLSKLKIMLMLMTPRSQYLHAHVLQSPSIFGEEHAEVVPSVSARYVRLFIDNSGPRCAQLLPSSQYYARVREFEVMSGATQRELDFIRNFNLLH